jgi:hypothetical protein
MQTPHKIALFILLLSTAVAVACSSDDGGGSDNPREDGAASLRDAAVANGDAGSNGSDGGAWTNAAACPMQAPEGQASCTQALECRYGGGDVCRCSRASPVDPMRWSCDDDDDDFGGPGATCPAAEPTVGTACMETRGECTFGTRACACADASDTWACWNRADCPEGAPNERATCSSVGMECEYETQGNDDLDCTCEASGWNCDRQICPATKPTVGGQCEEGDGTCTFGEQVCDCADDAWVCWRPSDCPAAAPQPLSTCATRAMTCTFADQVCECDEEGWDCD